MTTTAFAANDPLTVVNNLSDFIFGLIRADVYKRQLIPREKGALDLRELLLIAAGTLLGSCLGVTMMCLFQINKDCRVKRKEAVSYTHLDVYKRQAADSVIIPVQAQYLPAKGMTQLVQTISKVKKYINPDIKIAVSYTHLDVYKRQTQMCGYQWASRKRYGQSELTT